MSTCTCNFFPFDVIGQIKIPPNDQEQVILITSKLLNRPEFSSLIPKPVVFLEAWENDMDLCSTCVEVGCYYLWTGVRRQVGGDDVPVGTDIQGTKC